MEPKFITQHIIVKLLNLKWKIKVYSKTSLDKYLSEMRNNSWETYTYKQEFQAMECLKNILLVEFDKTIRNQSDFQGLVNIFKLLERREELFVNSLCSLQLIQGLPNVDAFQRAKVTLGRSLDFLLDDTIKPLTYHKEPDELHETLGPPYTKTGRMLLHTWEDMADDHLSQTLYNWRTVYQLY